MQQQAAFDGGGGVRVRKPYTITKAREKWTADEHARFVEAIRLHGRSWKKIEEHIGTKTAVQVRSHAQKFFNKIEKNKEQGGRAAHGDDVAIPPPRPKRRPQRPYPRKDPDSLTATATTAGLSNASLDAPSLPSPPPQANHPAGEGASAGADADAPAALLALGAAGAQQQLARAIAGGPGLAAAAGAGVGAPGLASAELDEQLAASGVTDATVAAVAAAASAAAAAAAAAVVSAAGAQFQAFLEANPQTAYHYFGVLPGALGFPPPPPPPQQQQQQQHHPAAATAPFGAPAQPRGPVEAMDESEET
ncbi:hypothetical protein MNEG_14869, partial [Monoraphidium neglectum]